MKQSLVTLILLVLISIACGSSAPTAAPISVPPTVAQPTVAPPTLARPSATVDPALVEVTLTFVNDSGVPLDYYWVNFSAQEEKYGTLQASRTAELSTSFEHLWRIRDQAGNLVMEYSVTKDSQQTVTIEGDAVAAADPVAAELSSQVQKLSDEGRISTTDGTYIKLEDFSEDMAQIGFLTYWYFDFELEHFVLSAHVKWSTALDTSDTSGCGIVFGLEETGAYQDYYGVILDKSRIYFTYTKSGYYYELGKTSGTGRLSFGNPAEADLILLVYDKRAFVYVDDEFIGEYTLSNDKPLEGKFGFGLISGTNRDYGTRCEISNAGIWSLK